MDLNLLVTLRALLAEGSVTRASARLGQSQPTVSRALQTLRTTFGDELLTRSGRGMTRTPLGDALMQPLERLLHAASRLATVGTFDPPTAQRTFHVSLPDAASLSVVPALTRQLLRGAPRCQLSVSGGERDQLDGLLTGALDLAIGIRLEHPELKQRRLNMMPGWTVLVGQPHPAYEGTLDREAWLASEHIQLIPHGRPTAPSRVDEKLRELGLRRTIVVKLGHVASIPEILRTLPLVVSLPRWTSTQLARGPGLRVHEHPLGAQLPPVALTMMWHESMQRDAGHAWLRELLVAAFDD